MQVRAIDFRKGSLGINNAILAFVEEVCVSFVCIMSNGTAPLVSEGDKIKIYWPLPDGTVKKRQAQVVSVVKSDKRKNGSYYKYELCFYKEDFESVSTRLIGLKWSLKSGKDAAFQPSAATNISGAKRAIDTGSDATESKPQHKKRIHEIAHSNNSKERSPAVISALDPRALQYVVAPMVGGSELAFRLLCRKYGATIAYTPMMSSERFAVDAEYRKTEFQTCAADRPLVAHFSANNPQVFLAAAKHVENECDAIGGSFTALHFCASFSFWS
jgi:hypothetical protein